MHSPCHSIKAAWFRADSERLPEKTYIELMSLLMGGRLPIAIMALTIVMVGTLAQLERPDPRTLALAGGIVALLLIRMRIVTIFKRDAREGALAIETVRLWELRYVKVVLPYAMLLGLLNLHLAINGGEAVRLLIVAETYGFCAGMVSRGFVRPQLCSLMVLMGALPTATGFLILACKTGGTEGLVMVVVASLFAIYAVSSLETIAHLYRSMLSQLSTKRELAAFARVDPLTGLANRLAMREKLASETLRQDGPRLFALMLIDFDGFKAINDRHGHPVGDRVLQEMARRMTETIRQGDLVVRLGGDEFCILQTSLGKPKEAEAMGNRLIRILAQPFDDRGTTLRIGSSIGIAFDDGSVGDIDLLIERADSALYRAKRSGGNAIRLWGNVPHLTLAA
ncbi:MAG: hypothetical protein JWO15_3497 [Sphingomonadales bacterium]|nr:hypothetical protein [Sphingomonadales bacterium]